MNPGTLRYNVALLSRSVTQNEYGEEVETWETLDTVWANKRDLSGREYFAAATVNAELTTSFTIRWRSDVTATMRIRCDGVDYDIKAVADPTGNKRQLILTTAQVH